MRGFFLGGRFSILMSQKLNMIIEKKINAYSIQIHVETNMLDRYVSHIDRHSLVFFLDLRHLSEAITFLFLRFCYS